MPPEARRAVAIMAYAQFAVALAFLTLVPILVELSVEFGYSVAEVGQLATLSTLASGVGAFVIGPVIDRYDRKAVIAGGFVVIALSSLLSAVAWDLWVMAVARLALGFALAGSSPAIFAAVGDLVPDARRASAMGWLTFGMGVAFTVGAPFMAFLAGLTNWRVTYIACALLAAIGLVAVITRLPSIPGRQVAAGNLVQLTARVYWPMLRNPIPRAGIILAFFGAGPFFLWQTYMGAFFQQRFDLTVADLAPALAMNGVGFLVGSLTGPRLADRFGRKIVIGICLALLGSAVLLQATVVAWFPASLALALIQSAMESSRIASTNALMSGLLPGARGALQSLYTSLTQLGITVTAPIGGVVLATWGYPGVGWYVAALCSVALLVLVVWVREVRTLHQPAVVPPVPRP